jgi:arylformamidase
MQKPYRNYTAEQLDALYSARAAVPEHPQIFQHWRERSERYRRSGVALLELRYGESERQCIDLFKPPHANPPLLVFFHGGYWQAMGKSDFSFLARELNAAGIAVAIPGYDLCPAVTLGQIVRQAESALSWLVNKSAVLGMDVRRVHLCGHSAGGQLIAMLLAAGGRDEWDARVIRSALSISGIFDLEPLVHTGINAALGLDIDAARALSPILLEPACRPPMLLAVGEAESSEFHRQSRSFARRWQAEGVDASYLALAGCNHFTALEQLADRESGLFRHALDRLWRRG